MANAKPKYKGVKFTLPKGRASFPAIFTPKQNYAKTGEEYVIDVLFDEDTDLKGFEKACDAALTEVYGADKKKWPTDIIYPLQDQQNLIEKAEEKGYSHDHLTSGAMFCKFKTNAKNGRPIIVGKDNEDLIDPNSVYGGCYVRIGCMIKINAIPQVDKKTKKPIAPVVYVTPYLSGVQFVGDGERFGGRANASEMFEKVEDEESSADDLVG